GTDLPGRWKITSNTHPDDATIHISQKLNQADGVAAMPDYCLRGELVRSMPTCVWDAHGAMPACASSNMRFHVERQLGGWLFAGSVSVDPEYRRLVMGSNVNASPLMASHAPFGWIMAVEMANPTAAHRER
ncbi:MAG: hypothetical protein AAGB07_20730, partial [Pseudomonadota bacterium]